MKLLKQLFAETQAIHAARPMVKMEATWLCSVNDFSDLQDELEGSRHLVGFAVDFQQQDKAVPGNPRIGLFSLNYRGFLIHVFETGSSATTVGVLVTGPTFKDGATTWLNSQQREIAASVRAGFSSPDPSPNPDYVPSTEPKMDVQTEGDIRFTGGKWDKYVGGIDPYLNDEVSQKQAAPLVFSSPRKVYYEGLLPTLPDRLATMLREQNVVLTPQAVMELPTVEACAHQLHADEAVTKHWPPYHELNEAHQLDFTKRVAAVFRALINLGHAKQAEPVRYAMPDVPGNLSTDEVIARFHKQPLVVFKQNSFAIGPNQSFSAAHAAMRAAHGVRRPHYPSGAQLIWENNANRYVQVSGPREEWQHPINRFFVELHPSDVEAMDWEVLPKVHATPPTV